MAAARFPLTIGVGGSGPGAGKDTVADMLTGIFKYRYGVTYEQEKFANPLRECLRILTGITDSHTQAGKQHFYPEWGMTAGQMLQKLGTDAIREGFHPYAWVNSLFCNLVDDRPVIISDVRFENEAEAVLQRQGLVVFVERAEVNESALASRDMTHPSEQAGSWCRMQGVVRIDNNGTLEELQRAVEELIQSICVSPSLMRQTVFWHTRWQPIRSTLPKDL